MRARQRSRLGSALFVLALVAAPLVVHAGDVRGTLTIAADYGVPTVAETDAARSRARYWEEWNGVLDARPPRIDAAREIAVVLTGSGPPADDQPPVRLLNGSLLPSTVVARAGTQLRIQNLDGIEYFVYAEGNDEVAAQQTAPESVRPVTLTATGNWPLRDRTYGHVQGHLHVIPDLVARGEVTADGHYVFHGVAPGTYHLHVFRGAHEIADPQEVVVTDAPLTVPAIAVRAPTP